MCVELIQRYGPLIPNIPFQAVAARPLADEHARLRDQGMSPIDCMSVNIYWAIDDVVAFVLIKAGDPVPVATYQRRRDRHIDIPHSFYIRLAGGPITTNTIVVVLTRLARWITGPRDGLRAAPADVKIMVASHDISKSSDDAEVLIATPLHWETDTSGRHCFRVQHDSIEATLDINGDFPDEALYRLCIGDDCIDLEDLPEHWRVPLSAF